MIISKANSILFVKDDSLKPSFDNVFVGDEPLLNHLLYDYPQTFLNTDTVKVQIKIDIAETATVKAWDNGGWTTITGVIIASYPTAGFKVNEYSIVFSSFTSEYIYLKINDSTDTFRSAILQILTEDSNDLLQIEWYNSENAFEMDYSNSITSLIRIQGILKDYEPLGTIEVYSNQGEPVKLLDSVIRGLNLIIPSIPRPLAEILTVGMACDKFYINEVEFVTEAKPSIAAVEMTNLVELTNGLTQRNTIGRNSHDTGFEEDAVTSGLTGDSFISPANSVHFVRRDSVKSNFDNTLFNQRPFENHLLYNYLQKFLSTDTVTIQMKVGTGITPVITVYKNDGTSTTITPSLITSYTDYDVQEFDINMSLYTTTFYLVVTAGADTWESEHIEIVEDTDELLYIEYFNFDSAFDIDYDDGLTHLLRIEGALKDYEPGGESFLYDNLGELTKLKEIVLRGLSMLLPSIPDYLAEKVRIAMAMDKFFVNEIEYVSEDKPTIDSLDMTNFKNLIVSLTQRNVLGINTHDIGYTVPAMADSNIVVKEYLNASGNVQITINEDYLLHTVTVLYSAGTDVLVKGGSTPGGDEVIYGVRPSVIQSAIVVNIHEDYENISTLYLAITGAGAIVNVYVQLINNRP